MRERRPTRALAALLVWSLVAPIAYAQDDPAARQVEKLASDAAIAYRGADYQRAVELLERAYSMRQVGALLYNLAKAYEKLGETDKAIELYRRYCDSTEAEPKLRAKAEARVAAYDEAHRKKEPPAPVLLPAQFEQHEEPPPPPQDPVQKWETRRRRARIAGLTLMSIAAGSAIAGMGLSIHAKLVHDRYVSTLDAEVTKRSARDDARTQAIVGDVLYGVAAASAAIGAYFVWRGYHQESPPANTAWIVPAISPTVAGVAIGGTF
jgi:tetratricopeptide (TPR) repeat protein